MIAHNNQQETFNWGLPVFATVMIIVAISYMVSAKNWSKARQRSWLSLNASSRSRDPDLVTSKGVVGPGVTDGVSGPEPPRNFERT